MADFIKKTFTGDTIEDAITQASMVLRLTSDKLGYEVIDKGAKGFLGLGARKVMIEAWDKEAETVKETLRNEGTKAEKALSEVKAAVVEPEKEEPAGVVPPTAEEIARFETGKKFLEDIFKQMGLEVLVEYRLAPEDTLEINLSGREMGVLIGKRGQTLDSLQYLTNLVVNRGEEKRFHVRVDTENYRSRRKETLESLAKNIAYKVKRTRKSMALEPMNAYERRIIHTTLQQDNFVMTKSEGEDPYRHVVVFYKRNRNGEPRP